MSRLGAAEREAQMMKTFDEIPVVTMPDGRKALIDLGASGLDIITTGDSDPVVIGDAVISPLEVPVDLAGIGRKIGAPRLDLLIGTNVLYRGFTADFRNESFEFAVLPASADEELAATLPYVRPTSGLLDCPLVKVEISGEEINAIFDTGAPYSLFRRRSVEPDRPAHVHRTDFHLKLDGTTVDFPVLMRAEKVRVGTAVLDLDVAYIPETAPAFYPECILGMDVPRA